MLKVKLQYEELIVRLHEKSEIKLAMKDVLKKKLTKIESAGLES